MSSPTVTPVSNNDPFGKHLLEPAVDDPFFELEIGNAVPQYAADFIVLFKHGHQVARSAKRAGPRQGPAGPLPMTATFLPDSLRGGWGTTHPWLNPFR